MSAKRNISILVGIIGLLIILLTVSIGYIVANNETLSGTNITENKVKVLQEIKELKNLYDVKIADKTNSYMEMQLQKDSIQVLVKELENSKKNAESLVKYKTQYQNLENKMKILVDEIDVLKSKKKKIASKKEVIETNDRIKVPQINVIKIVTTIPKNNLVSEQHISKPKIETQEISQLKNSFSKDVSTVKKNGKIAIKNLKAIAFTSKSGGKKSETNTASYTDAFKISFTLSENPDAESGEKTYYFQVINSDNNVMGKRITQYFDSESLTYSFSKTITYNNSEIEISQDFFDSNFPKGYYFINIFDRDKLVGKTSVLLK